MLRSRVMPSLAYLECHCSLFRRVRKQLVHRVLLLYLVVISALERWLLVAVRVRIELPGSADAAINFRPTHFL